MLDMNREVNLRGVTRMDEGIVLGGGGGVFCSS